MSLPVLWCASDKNGYSFAKLTELCLSQDITRLADSSVSALVSTVLPKDMAKAAAAGVMSAMAPGSEPGVLCTAIRVVQKFVDHHTDEVVKEQLSVLGPVLIRTYDHTESSVRKASVFALVSMHMKIGKDAMHPYTSHLPGCKVSTSLHELGIEQPRRWHGVIRTGFPDG